MPNIIIRKDDRKAIVEYLRREYATAGSQDGEVKPSYDTKKKMKVMRHVAGKGWVVALELEGRKKNKRKRWPGLSRRAR